MAQSEDNCQGVSARMMELLYGELSGEERTTIEAHLAGCASCRAELALLQSTRASARRALDADQPPARAHQAILRAAAAAVAAKQPKPIEARIAAPRPSFWERWRARWTLPTFATIGAVAVVVLASKVFLEPDKTVELGRRALQSAPGEAPAAPPSVAEPRATAGPAAAKEAEQAKQAPPAAVEKKGSDEAAERPQPSIANSASARSIAAPGTQRRRTAPADGFGALGGLPKGGGAASSGRAKAVPSGGMAFEDDRPAAPPAAQKPSNRAFAPPPPPLAEPARPSMPAANQARERETEAEALEETEARPRGSVGHIAGAAPPPARARPEAKAKKVEMPSEMDNLDRGPAAPSTPARRAAPAAAPAPSMADKADAESQPAAESPVARADRLFAQGQWAAAARAYRELLRRDPGSRDAGRWRQRLAASAAAASGPPAAAPAASPGRR